MPLLNYFAYGSNMSLKRLLARVPSTEFVSVATLAGHELRFHKRSHDGSAKCDAYETGNPNSKVIGILYTIDDAEKHNLDRAEGLGYGYDIKEVVLTLAAGNQVTAFTYYATDLDDSLLAYDWYLNHVLKGAEENRLPAEYIDKIKRTKTIKDPDQQRTARENAIHQIS